MGQSIDDLRELLLEGDKARAASLCSVLQSDGLGRDRIVLEGIEGAMNVLDDRCTAEHFNLLEIMLTGRAVMACLKVLFPPGATPPDYRATLVLGSLKGDVHDLGKNIFKAICLASGYQVIDCGKDCPAELLVRHAKESHADAVGISGLISSVVPKVKGIRQTLREHGLPDVLLLAGGAALRQLPADTLNVDFVAGDAFEGLHRLNRAFPAKSHSQARRPGP